MNGLRLCCVSLLTLFFTCLNGSLGAVEPPDRVDLAGTWSLRLDPQDQGVAEHWFTQTFSEKVQLPGSLQSQGFGDAPRLDSEWTGSIRPEVIQMPRYAPYREPANFKMPFWLQPKRYYVGPAWYQRDVNISPAWTGRRIGLHLERCHWSTQVWVDDQLIGKADSLSVPHDYDLTGKLPPGRRRITIRVDNRLNINVGNNSHSVTDHTQTNWNGIIGDIELQTSPLVTIQDVQVYPDIDHHVAYVKVRVDNHAGESISTEISVSAFQDEQAVAAASNEVFIEGTSTEKVFTVPLGSDIKLWSEQEPNLCRLKVSLHENMDTGRIVDEETVTFGVRQITTDGRRFLINGHPTYFRGTLECCIFPLTGFPPTDVDSWKRIVRRCKEFGLNHMRFHSWCPPAAAFEAADQLGFYFQIESASWANGGASVGDGKPLDQWLYDETDRILQAYGNHPSFVLLAYGNEPTGPGPQHQGEEYLGKWVTHYRQLTSRQLITCAAGWPYLAESQFHVMHHPLRQHGIFNRQAPETMKDYGKPVQQYDVPLISHETGQWCVFPNLDEMRQYTGVLEPKNFEIVRDFLESHELLPQARDFLMASGALQLLLYKEEIEVMLRTPELGGFQLLDLHDFPGQGTALIGVLDPFWDPKPYVTAEQFRRFCGPVVPLARLQSRTWTNNQTLTAGIEIYQFGDVDLLAQTVEWRLCTDAGQAIGEGRWEKVDLHRDGLRPVGDLKCPLTAVTKATHLKLTVSIPGTPYTNDWDVWVYPTEVATAATAEVRVTKTLDAAARDHLQAGGKVLFLPPQYVIQGDTYGSFETIFWNRLWFPTQQVHTLGILCDPAHAALRDFPTDSHSNWQWWDLCRHSKPMILDDLPKEITPIVQMIDDWNTCRKLALAFEVQVGAGKLFVCSVDLEKDLAMRPVARQLRRSLLNYMAREDFAPTTTISFEAIERLLREPSVLQRLEATITADSQQPNYEAANAMDGNPDTIWHTSWGNNATEYPHELVIDVRQPQTITGLTYQPRNDMSNGRIAKYAIYASQDGQAWGAPIAAGVWPDTAALQTVRFETAVSARYIKLVSESEVRGQAYASAAELDVILE